MILHVAKKLEWPLYIYFFGFCENFGYNVSFMKQFDDNSIVVCNDIQEKFVCANLGEHGVPQS